MNKSTHEIDYTPLQTIDVRWSKAIKDVYRMSILSFWIMLCLITLLVFIFTIQIHPIIFITVFLALLVPVAGRYDALTKQAFKDFAYINGWEITPAKEVTLGMLPPSLVETDERRSCSDIIHAKINGYECDIFQFKLTVGSGKSTRTYSHTVVRLDLGAEFPHVLLDSLGVKSSLTIKEKNHIRLEGDFNRYFKLYCNEKERIDALSVITPDVMQVLITSNQKQDIEIIGNNLFFISDSDERTSAAMPKLLTSVARLAAEIIHRARTMRYTAVSDNKFANLYPSYDSNEKLISEGRLYVKRVITFLLPMFFAVVLFLIFSYARNQIGL